MNYSAIPVRKFADDRSEMVSQLLFGECFKILSKKNRSWMRIQCAHDGYIGWIDPKQIVLLNENEYELYREDYAVAMEYNQPAFSGEMSKNIVLGASLPKYDGIMFSILKEKLSYSGQALRPTEIELTNDFVEKIARRFLHAPYLWGGRSFFGLDCSGFVQIVYKILGVSMPRDAKDQIKKGNLVDFVTDARVGDLAFFENDAGIIHHVGIISKNGNILHCSGSVREDNLDHFGIYQKGKSRYSHKLRLIKRVLGD